MGLNQAKDDPDAYAMYLIVNDSLGMSPGKIAAQVGHAVMELTEMVPGLKDSYGLGDSTTENQIKWYEDWLAWRANCRKVVLKANPTEWRRLKNIAKVIIVDSGYTEIAPNSETVIGFWPMKKSEAPKIVQRLQVL